MLCLSVAFSQAAFTRLKRRFQPGRRTRNAPAGSSPAAPRRTGALLRVPDLGSTEGGGGRRCVTSDSFREEKKK